MSDRKKLHVGIISVVVLVITVIGVSYAYFSANITGIENASTISMKAGKMIISYGEDNFVSVRNIFPRSEEWATKRFALTGTNTTALDMGYTIYLNIESNSFSNNALSYTLSGYSPTENQDLVNVNSNTGIPNTLGPLEIGSGSFSEADGVIHNYVLKIYFLDTGVEQNTDQEKELRAKINITDVNPNE